MTRILFTAIALFLFSKAHGQLDPFLPGAGVAGFLEEVLAPDHVTGGEVRISGDTRVAGALRAMILLNEQGFSFPGYRVQILSSAASRHHVDSLQRVLDRFEELFPDTRAYLQYIDPDFKIRVGNFKSKLEAMPLLKKIRKKYPGCYIVRETILLKDLMPLPEPSLGEEVVPLLDELY